MSLTGSCFSSESALGPFHHGIRGRSGTIFAAALSSVRTAGSSGHANSPHPSSREGHLSTAGWISSFLLSALILNGFHAAVAAGSRVHRNSVPSTHMSAIGQRCNSKAISRKIAEWRMARPTRFECVMYSALTRTRLGHGGTESRALPAAKKAPGPLVGTLESRHLKNDGLSVRYARVRFRPWAPSR